MCESHVNVGYLPQSFSYHLFRFKNCLLKTSLHVPEVFCLHVRIGCSMPGEDRNKWTTVPGLRLQAGRSNSVAHLQQVLSVPICVWRIHISSV